MHSSYSCAAEERFGRHGFTALLWVTHWCISEPSDKIKMLQICPKKRIASWRREELTEPITGLQFAVHSLPHQPARKCRGKFGLMAAGKLQSCLRMTLLFCFVKGQRDWRQENDVFSGICWRKKLFWGKAHWLWLLSWAVSLPQRWKGLSVPSLPACKTALDISVVLGRRMPERPHTETTWKLLKD